jgi:hypothetical protein
MRYRGGGSAGVVALILIMIVMLFKATIYVIKTIANIFIWLGSGYSKLIICEKCATSMFSPYQLYNKTIKLC